jgi:hypothetical protein
MNPLGALVRIGVARYAGSVPEQSQTIQGILGIIRLTLPLIDHRCQALILMIRGWTDVILYAATIRVRASAARRTPSQEELTRMQGKHGFPNVL